MIYFLNNSFNLLFLRRYNIFVIYIHFKLNSNLIVSVYDSIAKIPSGILNGNINQYGDFDQCVAVKSPQGVKGRYCLAYLQIEVPQSPYMAVFHDLVQSHSPFRSRLSDVRSKKYIYKVFFYLPIIKSPKR